MGISTQKYQVSLCLYVLGEPPSKSEFPLSPVTGTLYSQAAYTIASL